MSQVMYCDPRIPSFLCNNNPLPHDLLNIINRRLLAVQSTIAAQRAKRGKWKKGKKARTSFRHLVDEEKDYLTLLAPVRSIPNEIIAHIMRCHLPYQLDLDGRDRLRILATLCNRWRAVALSTPDLWRSLKIDSCSHKEGAWSIERLGTWFGRGGRDAELSLSIQRWDSQHCGLGKVVQFIANGDYRWTDISLAHGSLIDVLYPLQDGPVSCNLLQHMELIQEGRVDEIYPSWYDLPSTLPSLQTLHLRRFKLTVKAVDAMPTYPKLTSLHISQCYSASMEHLAEILHPLNLPSLEELIIEDLRNEAHDAHSESSSSGAATIFECPSVHRLVSSWGAQSLLRHLLLPNLAQWEVCGIPHGDDFDIVRDFAARSTRHLLFLSIQCGVGSNPESEIVLLLKTIGKPCVLISDSEERIRPWTTGHAELKQSNSSVLSVVLHSSWSSDICISLLRDILEPTELVLEYRKMESLPEIAVNSQSYPYASRGYESDSEGEAGWLDEDDDRWGFGSSEEEEDIWEYSGSDGGDWASYFGGELEPLGFNSDTDSQI